MRERASRGVSTPELDPSIYRHRDAAHDYTKGVVIISVQGADFAMRAPHGAQIINADLRYGYELQRSPK